MAPQEYKLKNITSLEGLAPSAKQEVEVEGIEGGRVLLVNAAGTIQALGSKCTHYGGPLAKGVLTKSGRLTCPWHGACFNAKTGDIEDAPALNSLPVFKTTERDGAVYITGEESAIKSARRTPNFKCAGSGTGEGHVVVVGGGSGAIGLVEGLREKGYAGGLTVITNEGYLPVDRPKVSKALIADPAKLALRDKAWFESGSVDWVDGEVVGVDVSERNVTTKAGDKISYTKLVLATGGVPRKLPLQGFTVLDNIFTLRSVHDAKKIVEAVGEKGKKVVVIGSSFIGLEVALALSSDNSVSVVGMEKVPLAPVLGEQVGAGIQKVVEGKGIKFYLGAGVDKAEPLGSDQSKVGAVVLQDGTRLEADLVILGVGVSPATEFLRDNKVLRLEPDGSLKTDETFSVVGVKDVYAIGDISTFPYHGPGGEGKDTRIEHWSVAQNSGRAVAAHIVNASLTPSPQFIPVFWSALGAQMRYCGNTAGGYDHVIVDGNPAEASFVAYYTQGETAVAVASMGRDPLVMQSADLMRTGTMPTRSQLEENPDVMAVGIPA
ncbi:NADPH-dependent 2,4-dienoyl-CoA reductase, sulfur reductase, or a related oxidoreductase [Geosmithia morbida]|uniref:NADPH-dependent 2,4-dienoyl-CoA reductase, sulfur reductase, or a related oxidoreductase n=1 Tax=Geosmithia morbida TaxID=1094350 RepID=A0A9P4YRL6_9HYPO|nr:NADPH-dependent 2,4-dienoyl-CoA reductase, sulfur reductase, or a related oxidoreductase [Geosmithia morbida]KAF4121470.1 NADPH-dependent 2,4-dienoyl-CoA reductase, sulfur reductase, or a related oxidoreductase [Geosmithia morbida]